MRQQTGMSHRLQPHTLTAHQAKWLSQSAERGGRGWSGGQLWVMSEMKEDVRVMVVREGGGLALRGQTSPTSRSMFDL